MGGQQKKRAIQRVLQLIARHICASSQKRLSFLALNNISLVLFLIE